MVVTDKSRRGEPKWAPRLLEGPGSKHNRIYAALVSDIADGILVAGDRLPPQREVALALGVDLTTVTRAYNRAREEGIIQAASGRGSFVTSDAASAGSLPGLGTATLDLSKNSPPLRESESIQRMIVQEFSRSGHGALDLSGFNYQDTGGSRENRAAGSVWLSAKMPSRPVDQVILCSGAQSALFAICHLLSRQTKNIAIGEYAYPGIHTVAVQCGLTRIPLAMDDLGILPDAFEEVARTTELAAIYITPTIDNPTTATMSEARRESIVAVARKHSIVIIEDDPYSTLLPTTPVSLATLAPELTWHIATLSKCVTAAMRLGYVACPSKAAAEKLAAVLQAMTMMASPFFAALATRWISSGLLADAASAIGNANSARQKIASKVFDGFGLKANPFGSHIWLALPQPWRGIDFAYQAERDGIMILPSASFAVRNPAVEAVRISVGAAPDNNALETALLKLRAIIEGGTPVEMRAVV